MTKESLESFEVDVGRVFAEVVNDSSTRDILFNCLN